MTFRVSRNIPEVLFLFAIVFGPLAFGAVEPWSKAILQIDIFLLLFCCALHRTPRPNHAVYKTLFPTFMALIALGMFQLLNPRPSTLPTSMLPSTASARATGHELLLWASYAALLWCAPQILVSRDSARRFAWSLFILGAFIAIVGIIQRGQGNVAYYGLRPVRQGLPFGPYVNRDHAASMMVMAALMGAGLFLSRWINFRYRASIGEKTDVAATQAVTLFLLGIVVFGIISSGSRGAVHSLFASLWITGLLATQFAKGQRLRWILRAAFGLLIPGYLAYVWFNPLWIGYILKTPDVSTAYRLSMYRSGLRLLRDFPLWGVGLGATQNAFPAYQEHFTVGIVDHVHGDWLEFAMETGAAGTTLALAGIAGLLCITIASWRRTPSRSARCLAAGSLAAIVAFLLHEAVDFSFHIPANAVIFLALTCHVGTVLSSDTEPPPTPVARRSNIWKAPVALTSLVLACASARPAAAWWYLHQEESAQEASKPALWERALNWDDNPMTHFSLAQAALSKADADPVARANLLEAALADSQAALSAEPLAPHCRYLQGAVLWRLGRIAEGKNLVAESHLLGY